MELSDIRVNPANHSKNDPEYDRWSSKKYLDIHNDINKYLDEKLDSSITDWGGQYASFLQNVGIEHQSDNGWWGILAVDPENIQLFVDYNLEDETGERINEELVSEYNRTKAFYKKLIQAGFNGHRHKTVKAAIEALRIFTNPTVPI